MTGRTFREGLAATGVILSLVFVGAEIRQNTVATRGATLTDLASGSREWLMAIASNPDLASAWRRWKLGEELNPDETEMAALVLNTLLRNVENVFLQVEAGAVNESALISYGFGTADAFRSPRFPDYWAAKWSNYNPGFVAAFEAATGNSH